MFIFVCMSFVLRSPHCLLYIVDKGNCFCISGFLPGFPSKELSKPTRNKWEPKLIPPLGSRWLQFSCLSVYIIISSRAKQG